MFIENRYIFLKSNSLFKDLDEAKLMELSTVVKVHTVYRSASMGYGEGDHTKIYFLVKGKVKIAESNEMGEELIKDILTEGDFFGDIGLQGNVPPDEYAEALTGNTIVCSFRISDFRTLLQENPLIALGYANKVSSKLRKLENRHADLVFRDTRERLIHFIKNWARTDGSRIGDKIVMTNYLTHSDIAGFISTSRQSVNVLLNELRESGLLYYNRKKIELNDPGMWN